VNFGTVDCTIHASLCRQHNIRSYPTTILYNNTEKQQFLGDHTATSLIDFLQDFINPVGMSYHQFNYDRILKHNMQTAWELAGWL
jgi:DnaJ family protein C protein 10